MASLPTLQRLSGVLFRFVLHRRTVTIITVVICSIFTANIVSNLVEADVLIPPASAAPAPARLPVARPPTSEKPKIDSAVLSERNIFCSSCTPEGPIYTAAGYSGQPAVLIATTVSEAGSRATLRVIGTEVQGSWGLDETVPGVGKITRIGGASIDVVDAGNHQKKLSLFDQETAGPGAGAATPARPAARPDPYADRVKKLGESSYQVDRDVVKELVANGGRNAGARAMPVMKNGKVDGLRFYGVRSSSLAGAIGLRSGDIVQAIDGDKIQTMQQLLDIYAKLDKLGGVELQGTRAGKPLSIDLRFR